MRLFPLIFCLIVVQVSAQIKAVTSNGDEVLLYEDGTWKYINGVEESEVETTINSKEFKRPASSTFQITSSKINVGVHINPKKWAFEKGEDNEPSEFRFQLKDKDAYGMLIAEKIEIPIENLKNIAVENARSVAPDIQIVKLEQRTVNGLKVLLMQMNGTIQGVKFTYYGYYYSFKGGTVQLLTYTAQNLLDEYKPDMEDFLNGFELTK